MLNYSISFSKKNAGFTILELVVAVAMFSVIVLLTSQMLLNIFSGSSQQFLALDNIDNSRTASSRFTNEIRNASVGVDGSYQVTTASDTQIIFYSKSAAGGATVNRIKYYMVGTTLYKGVIVPSGNPQVYNPANEAVSKVLSDVVNLSNDPIFTYYDGNYNGTSAALTQPVNVNSIKYVRINLTVLNRVKANTVTQFSISAGANIRNLKNNLGN